MQKTKILMKKMKNYPYAWRDNCIHEQKDTGLLRTFLPILPGSFSADLIGIPTIVWIDRLNLKLT